MRQLLVRDMAAAFVRYVQLRSSDAPKQLAARGLQRHERVVAAPDDQRRYVDAGEILFDIGVMVLRQVPAGLDHRARAPRRPQVAGVGLDGSLGDGFGML